MKVCSTALAVALTMLSVPTAVGTADADLPPAPQDLPPGTSFEELPSGRYESVDAWDDWTLALEDDAITTAPGARLVIKLRYAHRRDGSFGPTWYWANTRAGSTFRLTGCPEGYTRVSDGDTPRGESGVVGAAPVPRKQLQAAVRGAQERDFFISYDASRNSGYFEVAVPDEDQGPRLPGCPPAAGTAEPVRPDSAGPGWSEGWSRQWYQDDNDEEILLRVLDDDWLLVSTTWGATDYVWYGTREPSSFFISCVSGHRYTWGRVSRARFLQQAGLRTWGRVEIRYDADRDVGRFLARPTDSEEYKPCAAVTGN